MPRWSIVFACVLSGGFAVIHAQNRINPSTDPNSTTTLSSSPFGVHSSPPEHRSRPLAPPLQSPTENPDPPFTFNTLAIVQRAAGTIFRGTVTAVQRRMPTRSGEMETVEITFRVDDAFRGIKPGRSLMIREWVGLWLTGERYHVGERVVLFLYPPSKLGLTSPVGGRFGRFDVDEQELVRVHQPGGRRFPARPLDRAPVKGRAGKLRYRDLARAIRTAEE
jgi:hypothetical protein